MGGSPPSDASRGEAVRARQDQTIEDLRARIESAGSGRATGAIGTVGSAGSTDRRRTPPPDDGAGDDPGDPVAVAKAICLRLLTGSARTRADLAKALGRRGIPDDVAGPVLDRLTEVGLIDDAAYAQAFVSTRHRDRGLGRSALRAELRRKGVDPAVAADAAAGIDDEAERLRAAELVVKRLDSAMFAGPDTAKRRLLAYLARRGYPPGVAVDVVDEALRGFVAGETLDTGNPYDSDDLSYGASPGATWESPESD